MSKHIEDFLRAARKQGLDEKTINDMLVLHIENLVTYESTQKKDNKPVSVELPTEEESKITLSAEAEDYIAQELEDLKNFSRTWYLISPLIQACLPHKSPKGNEFTRRNGNLELSILAPSRTGLPYGVAPRFLLIMICSLVKKSGKDEIFLGKSIRDVLRQLNMPVTSGKRGNVHSYTKQLQALIATSFTIFEDIPADKLHRTALNIRNAHLFDAAQMWWDDDYDDSGAILQLNNVFFDAIKQSAVPLNSEALLKLKSSPLELDIYCWLSYKLCHLQKPGIVPWDALMHQLGSQYSAKNTFKFSFLNALKSVLEVYEDAQVFPTDKGLYVKPSKSPVVRTIPKKVLVTS